MIIKEFLNKTAEFTRVMITGASADEIRSEMEREIEEFVGD